MKVWLTSQCLSILVLVRAELFIYLYNGCPECGTGEMNTCCRCGALQMLCGGSDRSGCQSCDERCQQRPQLGARWSVVLSVAAWCQFRRSLPCRHTAISVVVVRVDADRPVPMTHDRRPPGLSCLPAPPPFYWNPSVRWRLGTHAKLDRRLSDRPTRRCRTAYVRRTDRFAPDLTRS